MYRRNLVSEIGEARVNAVEALAHVSRRWDEFELEQAIKYYKAQINELIKITR